MTKVAARRCMAVAGQQGQKPLNLLLWEMLPSDD
jgi:hypothetical protein